MKRMTCKERILSNDYMDIIIDYPVSNTSIQDLDLCYVNIDNLYNIIFANRTEGMGLQGLYKYQNIPKLYGLMQLSNMPPTSNVINSGIPFDPNSLITSGIVQVQRLPLNLTGSGVVFCLIDTGIDYTNAAFRDAAGNSRILSIWDQTIQSGNPPEGFLYGTQYTREDINRALQEDDPYSIVPSRDESGHGSAMAGVAAGSRLDNGNTYLGAAPDAEIVVVKLKEAKQYLRDFYLIPNGVPAYAENDIMQAVKYADSFAIMFQRPVVICIGIGTNMGEHDGNSALSRYLNAIAIRRSRVVVVGGGNEGNSSHHYRGTLDLAPSIVNNYEDVEVRVGDGNRGFVMEFWGSVPDLFTITVRSPGGETIPTIRLGVTQSITYGFIYEESQVTVDSVLVEAASGEELILFRIQDPTPGIWNFRVSAVGAVKNGIFNLWLPITEFLSSQTYFLEPDPFVTLVEPAMASAVIATSTYNDINDSFYIESGRGFSRSGNIRPDFAAPGVNISTIYGKQTGSSLAAAITAGGVAQFLQWAVVEGNSVLMESNEVKTYFIRGAKRISELTYPNREWGYGMLNVMGTFDALVGV